MSHDNKDPLFATLKESTEWNLYQGSMRRHKKDKFSANLYDSSWFNYKARNKSESDSTEIVMIQSLNLLNIRKEKN